MAETLPAKITPSAPFLGSAVMDEIVAWTKGIIAALVDALGTAGNATSLQALLTSPSVVTTFTLKMAFLFHDRTSQRRLEDLVQELVGFARHANEKGTLVDFGREDNLIGLLKSVEEYMENRSKRKEEILRNVALGKLIRPGTDDFEDRNFRYITQIVEMEDIEVLREHRDGALTMILNGKESGFVQDHPEVNTVSITRLRNAGLLDETQLFQGRTYTVSQLGKDYLQYIAHP